MSDMTIGQLAKEVEVNVETVRYYHRRGLLPVPKRPTGGIRRYSAEALARLRFIKRSQSLGFSLDDVEALLSLDDGQTCSSALGIGARKLAEVQQRMRDLRTLERALKAFGRPLRMQRRASHLSSDRRAGRAGTLGNRVFT